MPIRTSLRRLAVAALFVGACGNGRDYFSTDSEGWRYRAHCTPAGCDTEVQNPHAAQPGAACPVGTHAGFAYVGHVVAVACHACIGSAGAQVMAPERCRALHCAADAECPPRVGGAATRCIHELCEMPSQTVLDLPAMAGLCMLGAGPSDAPGAGESLRMASARAACADPSRCAAPAGCRAP